MTAQTRSFASIGVIAAAILLAPTASLAAEGGVGFYLLGSRGPAAGVVPPPGTYLQNDLYFYSGSAQASRDLPLGGEIVAGVDADAVVNLVSILSSTSIPILGGNLAFSATLPVGYQDVSASLSPGSFGIDDDILAIGDPVVGSQIGWHSGNLHYTLASLINVPIGQYDKDSIANVAFNRWGADLTFAASYIVPETGWDISAAIGVTFNGENPATDYTTGTEFHGEWAISKAFSPAFSAGIVGYYYDQISGDSGAGATLGDFKGRVSAVGLTAAYNFEVAQRPVSIRFKYFDEFDAVNRLEGGSAFLTLAVPL